MGDGLRFLVPTPTDLPSPPPLPLAYVESLPDDLPFVPKTPPLFGGLQLLSSIIVSSSTRARLATPEY